MGKPITITPHRQKSCLDKVRYKTEDAAKVRSAELGSLKHPQKKIRHLRPYKCEYCPFYHLTTMPEEKQ